jgi:hypothetical protein
LVLLAFTGCARKQATGSEINAELGVQFQPNPPVIGKNDLEITVTDAKGEPIQFGLIKVEGNMNHPGMKPVFTELMETDPGKYTGTIEFTMGGDWFLLVTSDSSAKGVLNQKIDVPGVKVK